MPHRSEKEDTVTAVATMFNVQDWAAASRVLLVEGDPSLGDMYALALELRGIIVERATNAADGLRMGRNLDTDLILLDVGLPDRSGLEVLSDFRADAQTREVKVVMFINDDEPGTISRALELRAVDYLIKARITPASLVRRVKVLLRDGQAACAVRSSAPG